MPSGVMWVAHRLGIAPGPERIMRLRVRILLALGLIFFLLVVLAMAVPIAAAEDDHTLTVEVVDEDGEPMDNRTVFVNGDIAMTEADGVATFTLDNGTYTIDVQTSGYEPAQDEVTIDGGDESVTLTLVSHAEDMGFGLGQGPFLVVIGLALVLAMYWFRFRGRGGDEVDQPA